MEKEMLEEELLEESDLSQVSGGGYSPMKKRDNNIFPKCGKRVAGNDGCRIEGIGVRRVYQCRSCALTWIQLKQLPNKPLEYHLVSNPQSRSDTLQDLGMYHG